MTRLTENQIAAVIAIAGTIAAGVLADLDLRWTAGACLVVAFGAVVYASPEL